MSEPFNLDTDQTTQDQKWAQSTSNEVWDKTQKAWKSVWKQNLRMARKGEAALQVPLALAIILGVIFPHMAAVVLLLGLAFGYSFTVDRR